MSTKKKTHRQLQKENTKQLILNTAYQMFGEKGYSETTMRLLAERAGVGLGTIFKHFPDKPSLLVEAYQEDLGKIISEAFKTIPEAGIKDQLIHVTRKIYNFYASNRAFSRTLIKESLFLDGEHGKVLDAQLMAFLEKVGIFIAAAVKRGELPPETDVFYAVQAFGAFYFSVLVMALKKPTFNTEEELKILENLIKNYLNL